MLNCIDATGSTPAIPCSSARSERQPHSLASHGISCHASTTAHGLGFGPCRPEVNGRNAVPPFPDSLRRQQRQIVELTGIAVDPLAPRVCAFASLLGWRCERSRATHGGARRPWHRLAISIHQAPKADRQRAGLLRGQARTGSGFDPNKSVRGHARCCSRWPFGTLLLGIRALSTRAPAVRKKSASRSVGMRIGWQLWDTALITLLAER